MNEIRLFENAEFGKIRTIVVNNEPWFVGKDVASVLGYLNPSEAIQDHIDEDDKLNSKTMSDLGQRGGWLINETGFYSLISSSKTKTQQYKKAFISWLKDNNILTDKNFIVVSSRREIEFLDKLETILSCFDVACERQHKVLSYKIDLYIPSLKIAIEFDENDHKNYTYEQQYGRQHEIEKELGCKLVRVSDKDSDELNIGIVLKEIMEVK